MAATVMDVLIVDDRSPLRSAARIVVGMVEGATVTAEAETGEDAVATAARRQP